MENITNMFALGGVSRANDTTQRGRSDSTMGATMRQRGSSIGSDADQWDDASAPLGDDTLAPNVGSRFGHRET